MANFDDDDIHLKFDDDEDENIQPKEANLNMKKSDNSKGSKGNFKKVSRGSKTSSKTKSPSKKNIIIIVVVVVVVVVFAYFNFSGNSSSNKKTGQASVSITQNKSTPKSSNNQQQQQQQTESNKQVTAVTPGVPVQNNGEQKMNTPIKQITGINGKTAPENFQVSGTPTKGIIGTVSNITKHADQTGPGVLNLYVTGTYAGRDVSVFVPDFQTFLDLSNGQNLTCTMTVITTQSGATICTDFIADPKAEQAAQDYATAQQQQMQQSQQSAQTQQQEKNETLTSIS